MTVTDKSRKIPRSKAKELLDRTTELITAYNRDTDNPLTVTRMVVFGSYANSDKEMLSDLDIALSWKVKDRIKNKEDTVEWDQWVDATGRFIQRYPYDPEVYGFMIRKALISFRKRSPYIQFTTLDRPEE